jgi:hypothetical protein
MSSLSCVLDKGPPLSESCIERLQTERLEAMTSLLAGVKPRVHHLVTLAARAQDADRFYRIGALEMSPPASNATNFDLPIGLSHRPRDGSVVSSFHCMNDPN